MMEPQEHRKGPGAQTSEDAGGSKRRIRRDMVYPAETVATKSELKPLLRLLLNDRQKLAKITNGDLTIKVSDPAMLAKIKISQLNANLEDLPIMQTHLLTKLLAMQRARKSTTAARVPKRMRGISRTS